MIEVKHEYTLGKFHEFQQVGYLKKDAASPKDCVHGDVMHRYVDDSNDSAHAAASFGAPPWRPTDRSAHQQTDTLRTGAQLVLSDVGDDELGSFSDGPAVPSKVHRQDLGIPAGEAKLIAYIEKQKVVMTEMKPFLFHRV